MLDRWARLADAPPEILVVGGASLDVLAVGGRTHRSAGGAGLYTALAARRAGAVVTMLAPRPEPMPEELAPALRRIDWTGPVVPPERLPRFRIQYGDDGSVIDFHSEVGAEPELRPALLDGLDHLPPMAFAVPFLDARLQCDFVRELKNRGCVTVANTYSCAAEAETETVRRTASEADVFFCNENEAALLWGSPEDVQCRTGQLVFVTLGAAGVIVFQGDHRTHVPAPEAPMADPTGAGDTFCGTVMASLAVGHHPVEAARRGVAAAAWMIGAVGPARLLGAEPPPGPADPAGARVDTARVAAVAALLRGADSVEPFSFLGPALPQPSEAGALDFFAAATLQQFGFWSRSDGHYGGPTYATIDGERLKGSDYLWAAYLRAMRASPRDLTPGGQAALDLRAYGRLLAEDGGGIPMPEIGLHHNLAAAYGQTMTDLGIVPIDLVAAAAATARPLATLLTLLDHVGGYREDPLRKKSALLGLILRQRPERWLPSVGGDPSPPIVDYHIQRTCLRTGMVLPEPLIASDLIERKVVDAAAEEAVRRSAYSAVELLVEISGLPMGAVDWFLFQMRHRCPEMTEPECRACPAEPACAQETGLFQPVYRTTAY